MNKNNLKKIIVFALIIISILGVKAFIQNKLACNLTLEGRVMNFAGKHIMEDCIVIAKSKHLLYYCRNGFIVRHVKWNGFNIEFPTPIAIGMGGRYETPVGEYYVCTKNANSRFTLFLGISYPNIADAKSAQELGGRLSVYNYRRIVATNILKVQPPWDTPLGGTYGIHGAPTYLKYAIDRLEKKNPSLIYVTKKDNTRGCVAVEHRVLKYLFANVDEGTPILILN